MSEVIEAPARSERAAGEPKPIGHWIGGEIVRGTSGRTSPVHNPATGEQTGAVELASVEEVDRAVATAKEAFPSWRRLSLSRRTEIMFRIRHLVHEHREDVARFLTLEPGKGLSDAPGG